MNKPISDVAKRALAEAQARHAEKEAQNRKTPQEEIVEVGGRKGPNPTRFGDWEKNGIISDF